MKIFFLSFLSLASAGLFDLLFYSRSSYSNSVCVNNVHKGSIYNHAATTQACNLYSANGCPDCKVHEDKLMAVTVCQSPSKAIVDKDLRRYCTEVGADTSLSS